MPGCCGRTVGRHPTQPAWGEGEQPREEDVTEEIILSSRMVDVSQEIGREEFQVEGTQWTKSNVASREVFKNRIA